MDKKEEKKIIRQEFLTGERALFMGKNLDIYDTLRPVSFCRYAGGRDYSILRGEKGRRY